MLTSPKSSPCLNPILRSSVSEPDSEPRLAVFECCPANGCSTAPLSGVPPLDKFGNCFPLTLGTATTDTTCHVCPDGSYSAASSPGIGGVTHNVRVCLPHSTCPKGKGLKSAGTTTTDTVCQDCNAAGTTPNTYVQTEHLYNIQCSEIFTLRN